MRAPADQPGGPIRALANRLSRAASAAGASTVRSRLFLKYVALFVAVVVLALVANGAFEIWFSYQEHKASLISIQREEAQAAAGKIEQFITEIESQVGWTTQLPWSDSTLEQRRFDALRLLRQVPAITELAQINASGHEQLRVSRLSMDVVGSGIDNSKKPEFTEAVAHKVYYGPVYFRRESEPYMTLSLAGTRRDTGVSIAQVNLKLIWDVVTKIKVGEHGHAYVVDADGRLIAHPDISLVLRNTDMSRLAQVRGARAGTANDSGEQVQEAEDIAGHKVLTAYAPVAPLGWLVFVETPIEEAYAPLYASIQRTGFVLLGALALAFIAGMFLAGRMVVPDPGVARGRGAHRQRRFRPAHRHQDRRRGRGARRPVQRYGRPAAGILCGSGDKRSGPHARIERGAGAADRDLRSAARHLAVRPANCEPVFEAMLENATRHLRCQVRRALLREEGDASASPHAQSPAGFAELRRREPVINARPAEAAWHALRRPKSQSTLPTWPALKPT